MRKEKLVAINKWLTLYKKDVVTNSWSERDARKQLKNHTVEEILDDITLLKTQDLYKSHDRI